MLFYIDYPNFIVRDSIKVEAKNCLDAAKKSMSFVAYKIATVQDEFIVIVTGGNTEERFWFTEEGEFEKRVY